MCLTNCARRQSQVAASLGDGLDQLWTGRDAAWAFSEAARIKKTSRRSEVRDDSAYSDSGNGGLGSSLTTIQLLNVNLRSAYGQGAGHNLRLCCHRGFSLRSAPHPRRHSLRGTLRLLVRTGCLPNRTVKICKRLAMARNSGNLSGNWRDCRGARHSVWTEAGGGRSAAKPVAARIAGESYNRKDRVAIWQSVRLELRHSAQNRAVYCVPSGRDSRLEWPGRYSGCNDVAEVDLDCPGPHPRHLFLARRTAVLRNLAAHL